MRTLVVVITGACGKIAYSLFNSLCSGFVFGLEVELDLRLVDIESKK
jgi:malate/lactate dehydrogenase